MPNGDATSREEIQSWLMAEGYSLSELTAPEAQWLIQASRQGSPTLAVGRNRRPEDQLTIQGAVTVDPQHKTALRALPADDRAAFLWDLRFSLLKSGVDFEGVTDDPDRIVLVTHVYLDGFSKTSLMNAMATVRNAVTLTIWWFMRTLTTGPGPAQSHAPIN